MNRIQYQSVALLALAFLGGCAAYVNYPALGKDDPAVNNPNIAPTPEVEAAALRWVIERYPVDGPFVVNLPAGTERKVANQVLAKLHNDNAQLITPESQQLPAFHVSTVWIRGGKATVEVIRPVTDPPMEKPSEMYRAAAAGKPTPARPSASGPVYQAFDIKLESRWNPWVVTHAQAWPIGTAVPPSLMGWPSSNVPSDAGAPAPPSQTRENSPETPPANSGSASSEDTPG